MKLTSSAFQNGGKIPKRYTCDGENINPELVIQEIPDNAVSLVLIMDDPDIPDFVKEKLKLEVWDHWVVFNIPAEVNKIHEDEEPIGIAGKNSSGKLGYGGPCPPDKEHRYFFKLYALDIKLDLKQGSSKKEVEDAMSDHVIGRVELIGKYVRN